MHSTKSLFRARVCEARKFLGLGRRAPRNGEFMSFRPSVVLPPIALSISYFHASSSSHSDVNISEPLLMTAAEADDVDVCKFGGDETLQERIVKAADVIYKKIMECISCLERIIFCTIVTTPAAVATPIAMIIGKEKELWEYLIWCIELLGPTFIKMAQWAATRPDLFELA